MKVSAVRITLVLMIILLAAGVYLAAKYSRSPANQSSPQPVASTPTPTSTIESPASQKIFYPMADYQKRRSVKWYGKYVTTADAKTLVCGRAFTGYHTGDDLEILPGELNQDVPVYSIANGTVREAQSVSGYGGLVVVQYTINGQEVTAYYGHIKLSSVQLKSGDQVIAGQKIAILGDQCSSETDGERKHLHFAIHKGTNIDVRGYVPTQSELSAWLSPLDLLGPNTQSPSG